MTSIDAVFANGVFKPLGEVSIPENQRVRLTVEPVASDDVSAWLDSVSTFHKQLVAGRGVLPDSASDIAADRRRHE